MVQFLYFNQDKSKPEVLNEDLNGGTEEFLNIMHKLIGDNTLGLSQIPHKDNKTKDIYDLNNRFYQVWHDDNGLFEEGCKYNKAAMKGLKSIWKGNIVVVLSKPKHPDTCTFLDCCNLEGIA